MCLLLLSAMCLSISAFSQDIIVKKDGSRIDAKVTEVSETSVKYLLPDNPDGPVYSVSTNSISTITYKNGRVENYNNNSVTEQQDNLNYPSMDDNPANPMSSEDFSAVHYVSDSELLKMTGIYDYHYKKAKTYTKVAWIGGGVLLALGATIPLICDDIDRALYYEVVGTPIMGAGIAWTAGWLIAAHNHKKKYQESVAIAEWNFISSKKGGLTAGINILKNSFLHDTAYGPSLTYTF